MVEERRRKENTKKHPFLRSLPLAFYVWNMRSQEAGQSTVFVNLNYMYGNRLKHFPFEIWHMIKNPIENNSSRLLSYTIIIIIIIIMI